MIAIEFPLPQGHSVVDLQFSPDSSYLACLSTSGEVEVWNLDAAEKQSTFFLNTDVEFGSVHFSASGRYLAVAADAEVYVWDSSANEFRNRRRLSDKFLVPLPFIGFNASETGCAVANHDTIDCVGTAAIISMVEDRVTEFTLEGIIQDLHSRDDTFQFDVYLSTFARHGVYSSRLVRRQDLVTSACEFELDLLHSCAGGYPVVSPSLDLVVVGHRAFGSPIEVLDATSGSQKYVIETGRQMQPIVTFSPDSMKLVWSDISVLNHSEINHIHIHSAETGELLAQPAIRGKRLAHLLTKSGKILAAWSPQGSTVDFWRMDTYELVGSSDFIEGTLEFSPNSRWVACGESSILVAELPSTSSEGQR